MSYEYCHATKSTSLPSSLWIPRGGLRVFRGSPLEIVQEMAHHEEEPLHLSVRESLEQLTQGLSSARRVHIELPWQESDEVCSALFLHALLQLGITKAVPLA